MPQRDRQGEERQEDDSLRVRNSHQKGPLQQQQARAADHGEGAHAGVPQNLQPRRAIASAEQPVARVQKPLNVDRSCQREQGGNQQRAHHRQRQHLPRRDVEPGQDAAEPEANEREVGSRRAHRPRMPGRHGQHRQEADGQPQGSHAAGPDESAGSRSETPASSKVAMSARQAVAISTNPVASSAPVPSPSRMPRSSRGSRARCSSARR